MTLRVLQVDAALRREHYYLEDGDDCYYIGDYISRGGYDAGPINNLISNLKKSVEKRGRPEYRYKELAIRKATEMLQEVLNPDALAGITFMPIPPSKCKADPLHDDRLCQILRGVNPALDTRDVLSAKVTKKAHRDYAAGEKRPTPDEVYANLALDTFAIGHAPLRPHVILFDDVLTAGTHFKACKRILLEHRPELTISGLFIGRTKRPAIDFADEFEDDF